jgi:hypothetical protein
MEVSGQLHAPVTLWRSPGTHWIGGWVGLRADLDAVAKKIPASAGKRTPLVQLVAKSLYWLSYPGYVLYILYQLQDLSGHFSCRLCPSVCLSLSMTVGTEIYMKCCSFVSSRLQWPRGLRRVWSWTARTLGSWVWIPLGALMHVHFFLFHYVLCR